MGNMKKNKIKAAIDRVEIGQLGDRDILSQDLADKIGNLEEREKITIRIDQRVLRAAKKEADKLGVGYQKIINDRLLEFYSIEEVPYLNKDSSVEIRELSTQIEKLNKRLNKIERNLEKRRA